MHQSYIHSKSIKCEPVRNWVFVNVLSLMSAPDLMTVLEAVSKQWKNT